MNVLFASNTPPYVTLNEGKDHVCLIHLEWCLQSEPFALSKDTINTVDKEKWAVAAFYNGTEEVSVLTGKIGLKNKEKIWKLSG